MEQHGLNGAYYGPSVQPQHKAYHRPGRGGGGCCCLGCCCECIFGLIFKLILTVVVFLGIVALALWLVFRPNKVTFHVVDASLSEFNLSGPGNNTLRYDLALNFTIRNPNKRVGIYYDSIEARPFYEGQRLGSVPLPTFYQGHKNTTSFGASLRGPQFVKLEKSDLNRFEEDKREGVYDVEVKLYMKTRLKIFWDIKTPKFKPKIKCELKVPLRKNGAGARVGAFEPTKCDVDF